MTFGRRPTQKSSARKKPPQPHAASADTASTVVAFSNAGKAAITALPETAKEQTDTVESLAAKVAGRIEADNDIAELQKRSRAELAVFVTSNAKEILGKKKFAALNPLEQRALITHILNTVMTTADARAETQQSAEVQPSAAPAPEAEARNGAASKISTPDEVDEKPEASPRKRSSSSAEAARAIVQPVLVERIDVTKAVTLPRDELQNQIADIVGEILSEERLRLNRAEQAELVKLLLDEMLGLGPLEPLLDDDAVTDIMVNGYDQIYVERGGKLELTDAGFRDDRHVMNVATRIVSLIGRRVDETSPLVDARLLDGSRVNIIIPPLAIDGPTISIRKFSKKKITLDLMEQQGNLSPAMAAVLKIASRARLNIVISGGTGSGKTTLLNALSQLIDHGERIVTIEDAAELQLQQPHVVRLETRPANLEGQGAISMRDLVKNSLRMRPDRIILGEVRGSEAVDMLQAMNTGHEGSMGTVHANRPREALTRLENMIGMAGVNLPAKAVRTQIADAIDMIVQVSRMRDGVRRITAIMEVVGTEGDVITTQDLFAFKYDGEDATGRIQGTYEYSGVRPHFSVKADYFGLERALMEALR